MSNINVYCPITSALIYVGSDRVDDLGQFTKFVLWAISNKYTINEISDAVSLGEIVVEDEVSYLSQIGFILDTESGFEITETGQRIYFSYTSLINITEDMKATPPRATKVNAVLDYYQANGELDKPVVVKKQGDRYELVDKYLRYYVAVKLGFDQIQAIILNE